MGICREGSKGQTKRVITLNNKTKKTTKRIEHVTGAAGAKVPVKQSFR